MPVAEMVCVRGIVATSMESIDGWHKMIKSQLQWTRCELKAKNKKKMIKKMHHRLEPNN